MRYLSSGLLLATLAALILAYSRGGTSSVPSGKAVDQAARENPASSHRYPDFGFMPPAARYEGRVFQLSQDYPQQRPAAGTIPAVCKGDFSSVKTKWRQYLLDVRAYCFEGNIDDPDVEDDWRVENNKKRSWYHMPWQHYGPNGREGIHGLTKEAPVQPRMLAWPQTHTGGQTYAVAFYSDFGGYTIGQVWKDHRHPAK